MSVTIFEPSTEATDLLARPAWMDHAICHGRTDLFFAPHAERPPARLRREAAARQVCLRCPVRAECRDHASTFVTKREWQRVRELFSRQAHDELVGVAEAGSAHFEQDLSGTRLGVGHSDDLRFPPDLAVLNGFH